MWSVLSIYKIVLLYCTYALFWTEEYLYKWKSVCLCAVITFTKGLFPKLFFLTHWEYLSRKILLLHLQKSVMQSEDA